MGFCPHGESQRSRHVHLVLELGLALAPGTGRNSDPVNADFTHLHLHSQFSLLDGALRFDDLFKTASADKMEAVALTDHGNMFGALDFYLKAKSYGIKPILGCEVYMAP